MNRNKSIAIIGGGNVGTYLACICAQKGYSVKLYSTKPWLFERELEIIDEFSTIQKGIIELVSSNIELVLQECNMILITYPAFLLEKARQLILPYINPGISIGFFPGTGGVEFIFKNEIKNGISIFGLQRVPCIARLVSYGKRVCCQGIRNELFLASFPSDKALEYASFVSEITGVKCTTISNYLNITLTPSNPILHTSRLRILFQDYHSGKIYHTKPLFYADWDDESSHLLLKCDEEVQQICKHISQFNLCYVKSLKEHYGIKNYAELTKKLQSIPSLHAIEAPMLSQDYGWIPDFSSRYFIADFSFGLSIIKQIADFYNINVPNITETLMWYQKTSGDTNIFDMKTYGFSTQKEFFDFYLLSV